MAKTFLAHKAAHFIEKRLGVNPEAKKSSANSRQRIRDKKTNVRRVPFLVWNTVFTEEPPAIVPLLANKVAGDRNNSCRPRKTPILQKIFVFIRGSFNFSCGYAALRILWFHPYETI